MIDYTLTQKAQFLSGRMLDLRSKVASSRLTGGSMCKI